MPCHLLTLLFLTALFGPIAGQLKFGGSRGGGSSSGTKDLSPADGDTRFFGLTTGNQAVDGGIVGLGLGAIGAAVLGPTIGRHCSRLLIILLLLLLLVLLLLLLLS